MMVIVEQLVEWKLAGETEVLGKPATNRLSYGTALHRNIQNAVMPGILTVDKDTRYTQ
jgi:hypothetical protein